MKGITWLLLAIAVGVSTATAFTLPRAAAPAAAANGDASADSSTDSEVYANGVIEGSQREVKLRFEVAGTLAELPAREGLRVRKGDLLARLDGNQWQAQLSEARLNVELAKAELERLTNGAREETRAVARALAKASEYRLAQAKQRLTREELLAARKAAAQANLDDVRSDYKAAVAAHDADRARLAELEAEARPDERKIAQAKVGVAEARVHQVEAEIAKSVLRAPTDGIILRVQAEVGEMLAPQLTEPVITMVNIDQTRVRAYVEEGDAFRVVAGQRVEVAADGISDRRFRGSVISIAPSLVPKRIFNNMPGERVDVKVREVLVLLEAQEELAIGLPVDVFIQTAKPMSDLPLADKRK